MSDQEQQQPRHTPQGRSDDPGDEPSAESEPAHTPQGRTDEEADPDDTAG